MLTKFIKTNQQDKNDLIKNIDEFKMSVNSRHGAVAMKTGGARNIPRGFVGVSEIGPGYSDRSKLNF